MNKTRLTIHNKVPPFVGSYQLAEVPPDTTSMGCCDNSMNRCVFLNQNPEYPKGRCDRPNHFPTCIKSGKSCGSVFRGIFVKVQT